MLACCPLRNTFLISRQAIDTDFTLTRLEELGALAPRISYPHPVAWILLQDELQRHLQQQQWGNEGRMHVLGQRALRLRSYLS
jgi:hypothetical protein